MKYKHFKQALLFKVGSQVKFENNEDKTLRLYYEWNSHSSIENIVKELNQFENVNIELQQNELIVK